MKFEELYEKCKRCNRCRLRKSATQVVPGEGNTSADIMFIGEGPGKNEDVEGVPFCGAAGKFLDEMLASIGVKREDVFITNMVRCRPPKNRDPQDDEIKACKEWTNGLIKIVKPKIFVLLGRFAMAKFFPKFKISQVHGNAYNKWGRVFVIMYHPAVALYNNSFKDTLVGDMGVLREILDGNEEVIEKVGNETNDIKQIIDKQKKKKHEKDSQMKIDM